MYSRRCKENNQLIFCKVGQLKSGEVSCIREDSKTTFSVFSSETQKLKCSFHKVFNENDTQENIFEYVGLPLVNDLLKGKSSLLVTYGSSGRGEKYAMAGNCEENSIMPYIFGTIFSSTCHLQAPKFLFKPDKMNGFEVQSETDAKKDRQQELRAYMKLDRRALLMQRKHSEQSISDQNISLHCPPVEDIDEDKTYAIFVSFIIIYGNGVYDLLDITDLGKFQQPQTKIVREDSTHKMYVHGIVEEEVKSSNEGYHIYLQGIQKKKMVAALLNSDASSLHSFFTIRLVQAPICEKDKSNKSSMVISQLCLLDLAHPMRRNSKNKAVQKQLVSGQINSITALKSCLDIFRENQILKNKKLVPFRDSKLTYLLKNYFEERNKIHMLLCLNPSCEALGDILNVLKFADVEEVSITEQKNVTQKNKQIRRPFQELNSEEGKISKDCNHKGIGKNKVLKYTSLPSFPALKIDSPQDCNFTKNLVLYLQNRKAHSTSRQSEVKTKGNELLSRLEEVQMRSLQLKQDQERLLNTLRNIKSHRSVLETRLKKCEMKATEMEAKLKNTTAVYNSLEQELKEVRLKREALDHGNTKNSEF